MGSLFQTDSSARERDTFVLAKGNTTGTPVITKHDVTVAGAVAGDRTQSVLKLDAGSGAGFVSPYPPKTGPGDTDAGPVRGLTIRDLTIDAQGNPLASVVNASKFSGPTRLVVDNVRIINTHPGTIALFLQKCADGAILRNVAVEGDGQVINISDAVTDVLMEDVSWWGGKGGIIVSQDGYSKPGIVQRRYYGWSSYWQSPALDSFTATAFGVDHVDVASTVAANRTQYETVVVRTPVGTTNTPPVGTQVQIAGLQVYDRVEDPGGIWGQVEAIDGQGFAYVPRWFQHNSWKPAATPTSGTITAYRNTLGRLYGWTSTSLHLYTDQGYPVNPHWRTPSGTVAATPTVVAGQRVDLLSNSADSTKRTVDIGGVHWTAGVQGAVAEDGVLVGHWGDQFTDDGDSDSVCRLKIQGGQDVGFTNNSSNGTLCDVQSDDSGFVGIDVEAVCTNLYIKNPSTSGNGRQGEGPNGGSAGYGIYTWSGASYLIENHTGSGNETGLKGGAATAQQVAARMPGCQPHLVAGPRPRPGRRPRG